MERRYFSLLVGIHLQNNIFLFITYAVCSITGGAVGTYGFTNTSQAQSYADQIWGLFGNGGGSLRPFDDAVVDGFDLDIEGGTNTGYAAFITQMRTHYGKYCE